MQRLIRNPLARNKVMLPIQSVLRILAGQNGCDGVPYDQMVEAADYIDELEQKLESVLKELV